MNVLAQRQNRIIFLIFTFVLVPGLLWQFWFNLKNFIFGLIHIPKPTI